MTGRKVIYLFQLIRIPYSKDNKKFLEFISKTGPTNTEAPRTGKEVQYSLSV